MHTPFRRVPQSNRLNRRDFLASAAAATAGVMFGRSVWADEEGFIDAHSHIWTRDVEHFPLAKGATVDDLDPPSFTAEELLGTCRPEGVQRVVLIQHHTYYGFDNRYLIHAAQQYPGVFKVVGMVDDQKPHPDVTMQRLLEKNVTGFRITSWIRRERWLDGPGMALMWRTAAETRQAMCCLIDPPDLAGVGNMCGRYAETPVVIDHFARIGADGEIRDADVKALCDLARHPQVHVKISAFYALGKKKAPYLDLVPMIRRLYDAYGPQRLMWASDSPYQVVGGHKYHDSIALVRDRLDFLSASDRDWLLRKTAENVYFTPGSNG